MSKTREQLEKWISGIDVTGNVIDIGGSQKPVRGRTKSWHNVEHYDILDLPRPHAGEAPHLMFDIQEPIPQSLGKLWNVAFCLEVSEYWYKPFDALKNIASLLETGGKLYISFHFIYPVHNPSDQDFLRYTRNGAIKLLLRAGFAVESVVPRIAEDPMMLGEFFGGEGMRPAKDYSMHIETGVLIEAIKK